MKTFKIYYRRRLPHFQPPDSILFITFRLKDTLPNDIIVQLYREREERKKMINKEQNYKKRIQLIVEEQKRYFGYFDSYLDRVVTNIRWLNHPTIAKIVFDTILHYDYSEYLTVAFTIMPNHVHLLLDMKNRKIPLYDILKRIKSFSALKANKILSRKGQFWHSENYDHVVRDSEELKRIVRYIVENRVKAGLCQSWNEWRWTYLNSEYLQDV